jgi:2-desacetyl-2-hydroxyethyl bacteriochlorophyllide A dehydrogenase
MSTPNAIVLGDDLALRLDHRETPDVGRGEVLVRVEWTGVCGSDLHVLRSGDWVTSWPAVLGHENVGVVESCPGSERVPGERVVLDSRVACGECAGCESSPHLCTALTWLGESMPGGYQQRLVVPVSSTVSVPAELESDIAVLAEPLAVALHTVHRAAQGAGGKLGDCLLLGAGPIGQLIATLLLDPAGDRGVASVTAVEPHDERRRLAEAVGCSVAPAIPSGRVWDTVIDAAGYSDSLLDGLGAVGRGGTVVLVALAHRAVSLMPADLAEKSVTLIGVNGFQDELPLAVRTLAAGPESYRPLITDAVLLDEAPEALARWVGAPPVGKAVIRP